MGKLQLVGFLSVIMLCQVTSIDRIRDTTGNRGGRIFGGVPVTTRGQIPYIVAIDGDNSTFCTGSIISRWEIVTAAHCIVGYWQANLERVSIRAGLVNLNSNELSAKATNHQSSSSKRRNV